MYSGCAMCPCVRSAHLSMGGVGGDTVAALCRKQYYSGLVSGLALQDTNGDISNGTSNGNEAGSVRAVVENLRSALRNHMAGPVLQVGASHTYTQMRPCTGRIKAWFCFASCCVLVQLSLRRCVFMSSLFKGA